MSIKTRIASVGDRAQATSSDDEDQCIKCEKGVART